MEKFAAASDVITIDYEFDPKEVEDKHFEGVPYLELFKQGKLFEKNLGPLSALVLKDLFDKA